MKKKISLCVISILFGSAIYAGPIQERLEAALKETEKNIKNVPEIQELPLVEWEKLSDSARKRWVKQQKQSDTLDTHLGLRAELLHHIIICLKQNIREKEISSKKESVIATKCFNELVVQYQDMYTHYKKLKKILNQEMEIIRKRDLRQSWFWWLW